MALPDRKTPEWQPRYVDLIARIHAGHAAERALAASLDGRTVAVRGVTGEELATLVPLLVGCGATPVRVLAAGVAALVAGSRVAPEDLIACANRDLAVLRQRDVALIHAVRARVGRRDEALFRQSVDRALDDARRVVRDRARRRPIDPVETASRMHVSADDLGR
jgi:hypothetical protein